MHEIAIMKKCENKIRHCSSELSHWVLFLLASSKLTFSQYNMVPLEDVSQYLSQCSRVDNGHLYVCSKLLDELARNKRNTYLNYYYNELHLKFVTSLSTIV